MLISGVEYLLRCVLTAQCQYGRLVSKLGEENDSPGQVGGSIGESHAVSITAGTQILVCVRGIYPLQHPLIAVDTRFCIFRETEPGSISRSGCRSEAAPVSGEVFTTLVLQIDVIVTGILPSPKHGSFCREGTASIVYVRVLVIGSDQTFTIRIGEHNAVPNRITVTINVGRPFGTVYILCFANDGSS